jgi:hypothetical protein
LEEGPPAGAAELSPFKCIHRQVNLQLSRHKLFPGSHPGPNDRNSICALGFPQIEKWGWPSKLTHNRILPRKETEGFRELTFHGNPFNIAGIHFWITIELEQWPAKKD